MASRPSDRGPVLGQVDRSGRLISADPELEVLQVEAGSRLGAEIALPQLAAIAALASKLGVPISRAATVAGADQDIQMFVRATPGPEGVSLALDRWTVRPPEPPRLARIVAHVAQPQQTGAPLEWSTNDDMRIVSISPGLAEKLGASVEQILGQPITRIFRLEEGEDGDLPLLSGVAARTDFTGQRARSRTEQETSFRLGGSAVRGPDGRFAGFKGEARQEPSSSSQTPADVTAEFDAALDEALRTPLGRIIESADRIAQQSDGALRGEYADYAADIAAAARHLLSVIHSMSAEAVDVQERVDLGALATDAAGMLEPVAEAHGVSLALENSQPLVARGEPRGVTQILLNLIGNAVRHSPSGTTATISLERSGDMGCVHVSDQGPGIDSTDQQRIFERFERGSSEEGGTGLGLAISRRLARSMGGDIRLESTPGMGARFTLLLPTA